nr:caspase family protein [uncultured Roseibium sp.]
MPEGKAVRARTVWGEVLAILLAGALYAAPAAAQVDDFRLEVTKGHTSMVGDLSVSLDGRLLSSTDQSGVSKLWDIDSGAVLLERSSSLDGSMFRLLPDGSRLARIVRREGNLTLAGFTDLSGRSFGAKINGRLAENAFSADGATVALSRDDGALQIIEIATGRAVFNYRDANRYGDRVLPSPDHTVVLHVKRQETSTEIRVQGLTDKGAGAWSAVIDGAVESHLYGDGLSAGFSPSGQYVWVSSLASASIRLDVWETSTGASVIKREYPLPRGEKPRRWSDGMNMTVVWAPSEERLAFNRVPLTYVSSEILDLITGEPVVGLDTRLINRVYSSKVERRRAFRIVTAFLSDEKRVVTSGDLVVWDTTSGQPVDQLFEAGVADGGESGYEIELHALRHRALDELLVLHESGSIYRYALPELELLGTVGSDLLPVYHAAWTADGSALLHFSARKDVGNGLADGIIQMLDMTYGRVDPDRSFETSEKSAALGDGLKIRAVAPDLSYVIAGQDYAAAQLFRRGEKGNYVPSDKPLQFSTDRIGQIAINFQSPDKFRISQSGKLIIGRLDFRDRIAIFDSETGDVLSAYHYGKKNSKDFIQTGLPILSGDETRIFLPLKSKHGEEILSWSVDKVDQVRSDPAQGTDFSRQGQCKINQFPAISSDGKFALGEMSGSQLPCIGKLPDGELAVELEGFGRVLQRSNWPDTKLFPVERADFTQDGRLVAAASERGAIIWNTAEGKMHARLVGHSAPVSSLHFSPDNTRIATSSYDGTVRLWTKNGEELLRFYLFADGEWLAISPEGFFNGSDKGAKRVNVVRGGNVFPIDSFFDALYRPDLVREALAGDLDGKVAAAAAQLDLEKIIEGGFPPRVRLISPEPGETVAGDGSGSGAVDVEVEIEATSGGIGKVEWSVNGVLQDLSERALSPLVLADGVDQAESGAGQTKRVTQSLYLAPGENEISVVAYNAAGLIASDPLTFAVALDEPEITDPKLYVLSVGVNDYFDSRLDLAYAASDARAIGSALKIAGKEIYSDVIVETVLDKDVTKAGLEAAFNRLETVVRPGDVFVFFLAGHGKTEDGRYYFLPHDFRYQDEGSFKTAGIGQTALQEWFSKIRAQKSVLLFDTCESGTLTQEPVVRGTGALAAINRLNRAIGRTTLTASTDTAPALEGFRGHGLFTYTLLDAIASADNDNDRAVDVTELASYIDRRLPEYSEAAFGYTQVPQMKVVGNSFPIAATTLVLSDKPEEIIPKTPTHVVIQSADVIADAIEGGAVVTKLQPGTTIRLLSSENGWVLVAKDGDQIGYLADNTVVPLR